MTVSFRATSSNISVGFDRPFTMTTSKTLHRNSSSTPLAWRAPSSMMMLTLYLLHKLSSREARLTLSPTRPNFIRWELPMLPASTVPHTRPIRTRTSGFPLFFHPFRSALRRACCAKAACSAMMLWFSPSSTGAFHHAMIASPMNSPTTPWKLMITLLISSKYSASKSMKSCGSSSSAIVVKLAMSLKKTVTSAFATPRRACRLLAMRSCTMFGSM
mmetsp:Transcript_86304/g.168817  ORF Transcript_86304/g.168817 Transcript_86304/m.168817 type:complete len:216 (-) Transcript_86304:1252-1899(-)